MSSYIQATEHPITKEWQDAFWIDDMFGHHNYGVVFKNGDTFDPRKTEVIHTRDERISDMDWDSYPKEEK